MAKDNFSENTLNSPSGATIRYYRAIAPDNPRGVIQVNHGLAEHAARYARFAEFMAGHRFHLYAHDHRGHGATSAPDAPLGMFSPEKGVEKLLGDVEAMYDLIGSEHPGLPIVCFGHSMGGLIALNFTLSRPDRVAALAIWNSNFSAGLAGRAGQLALAWERFRLGADIPSRILPKLTFDAWAKTVPDRKTGFDWLSHDAEEVAKYVADPLCGWNASVSMWQDVFRLIFNGADNGRFSGLRRDLPIHLLGGKQDPATDGGKAVDDLHRRLQQMKFANTTCHVLPGTRHESLNEINRDKIMADFATWLEKTL